MQLRSGDYSKRHKEWEMRKGSTSATFTSDQNQHGHSECSASSTNTKAVKISNCKRSAMESVDQDASGIEGDYIHNKKSKEEDERVKAEIKEFLKKKRMLQREMNFVKRKAKQNNIPHSWLGAGTLLRLMDPTHSGNYIIFQRVWRREQPLIVSDVSKNWNDELWNPTLFSQHFGNNKNDFINCMNGEEIPNQPMQVFWDGFEDESKRLKDDKGCPMILKMKEWPQGKSFEKLLPSHMNDLLEILPLASYTHPRGLLNCVNALPDGFVKQDLGTKLFCAYGSIAYPSMGTMNLNINECDVAGLLVYVGLKSTEEEDDEDHDEERILQAINNDGCDDKSVERVSKSGEIPGAVWHIYNLEDVEKISQFLKMLSIENGAIPPPHHDPIKDGTWYLDYKLRERLFKEYRVEGRAVLQCLGDAVLIPSGAPHQVHNLRSCITVMHSFVSRQNVKKLT